MRVFVLCEGEFSEGHSPVGVFTSLVRAQRVGADRRLLELKWEARGGEDGNVWVAAPRGVDESWIYALEVEA